MTLTNIHLAMHHEFMTLTNIHLAMHHDTHQHPPGPAS